MTKQTFTQKSTGDTLSASEWNDLTSYINTAVDAINEGAGSNSSSASGVIAVSSKGNTEISSAKHINLEPAYDSTGGSEGTYGDIQMKPGDDITLESSHRETDKREEICIKTTNGLSGSSKSSVKLQLKASDITLSTEGKKGNDANVMNVNVTTGSGKGYLKVRAQAIDLRCEDHGGVALQPKGVDGEGHENKIKFEHGGGDGLEFGTFNSEKTSLYTGEYRFKKTGRIKLATRTKVVSDKYNDSDETTHYKYTKAADDFYDNIDQNDPTCTWKDIISYIAWAKNNQEGPFDINYLLNDQIDNKQRYIVFDSSYAPNTTQDLINGITSITIMYAPTGENVEPTEVTLYVNSQLGAGASGSDNGTDFYDIHFQSTSDENDPARITKDVHVQFRPDGTVWVDRMITPGEVDGTPSASINDAIEYITSITYNSNPQL